MYQRAPAASPTTSPYGHAAVTTVEGPPAPPPRLVSKNGVEAVFAKKMEGNFCFTVKPSVGPGDAPIGALPSLGRGLQSL